MSAMKEVHTLKVHKLLRVLWVLFFGSALLVILLIVLADPIHAATLTVGSDGTYSTIQAAIDAASPGDTIQVRDETFTETLVITQSLSLEGGYVAGFGSRTPRTTRIFANTPNSVIDITGLGIEVTVDGFEIQGGNGPNGGGIYVFAGENSQILINDNYIHDNFASDGGGVNATGQENTALTITNNDIMTNTASSNYGGIYVSAVSSSTLTISQNDIIDNEAVTGHGGFYVGGMDNSQFQMDDNIVRGNDCSGGSYGGGYLSAYNNTRGTFKRNQIIDNRAATDYGGLYLIVIFNSHITGENLEIKDNTANSAYGGGEVFVDFGSTAFLPDMDIISNRANSGGIGGVRFFAIQNSMLEIPSLYAYDNVANGSAGGIDLDASFANATIIATDATVISNSATLGGGGGSANVLYNGLIDLTGSRFKRNTSGAEGGGLLIGSVMFGSRVSLSQTQYLSNTAGTDGGGLYVGGGPFWGSQLELSNARFISNTATSGDGGGLFLASLSSTQNPEEGGKEDLNQSEQTASLLKADHLTVNRNTAGANAGGAFIGPILNSVNANFDDSTFMDNIAGGSGGAAYILDAFNGSDLSIRRSVFEGNDTNADGGAIFFLGSKQGSNAVIDNNHFRENTAGNHGGAFFAALFSYDGSYASFSSNTVLTNTATNGSGGGVYIAEFVGNGSTSLFNDNRIQANTSGGRGGGAVLGEGMTAFTGSYGEVDRNTVVDNLSGSEGGGLFLSDVDIGSRFSLQNNVITGNVISNTVSFGGGGVSINALRGGSTMTMTHNVLNDNIATGSGGGFLWSGQISMGSNLYFENNTLQNNLAAIGGGCFYQIGLDSSSKVYFTDNLVNGNIAKGDVGGCSIQNVTTGSNAIVTGNQFNNNTSKGSFGALSIANITVGSQLTFSDNEVIGNQAGLSGTQVTGGNFAGVYLSAFSFSNVDMRNNQILSNTAFISGTTRGYSGGLFAEIYAQSLLTMRDNEIVGNVAQDIYGGIHIALGDAEAVLERNLISTNAATTEYGGVAIQGDASSGVTLRFNEIVDNSANSRGGLSVESMGGKFEGTSINNLVAGNTGGGVSLTDTDFHSTNDTIAENGAYGIMMTGTVTVTTSVHLTNAILWGHTDSFTTSYPLTMTMEANYSDIEGGFPGTGNLSVDPQFVGGGNYHLRSSSPVIDQGTNVGAPAFDLDGLSRPVNSVVDMGAYEFRFLKIFLPVVSKN